MSEVIFGLGSNLNNPVIQLQTAVDNLGRYFSLRRVSSIYKSQSLLKDNQDDYYNIAVLAETDKSPQEILSITQSIEKNMGRVKFKKWGERVIDIDIIDYNREIIEDDNLQIPHNQMIYRSFVLNPLKDIIPEYIHPVLKLSVQDMINNLEDDYNIIIYQNKFILLYIL
ncbi:MAG: 2-amino-4-hydroxy-6-hydroxymethyldihydropteridine diphosphokinase [Mucispirillum sp.]|nr:2-amino-4-hydroxy-6-hydroxymethyldihydropteridine diphosphokinase [Mucispirillum sp.]